MHRDLQQQKILICQKLEKLVNFYLINGLVLLPKSINLNFFITGYIFFKAQIRQFKKGGVEVTRCPL